SRIRLRPGESAELTPRRPAPARSPRRRPQRRLRLAVWITAGLVLLAGSLVLALTLGPANTTAAGLEPLRPGDVVASAAHHVRTALAQLGLAGDPGPGPLSQVREAIIWQGRAPRVLTAVFVGAGLALAGAVMQSVTRNPLAD